ncbi:MAG TPA: hypothetical protein VG326_01915 [Tepidisphaeraceae bacterium]|nr:hypothetical protein [Tepidisphaeraceae bacterium]
MWYELNPDDTGEFEKQMRRKVHYIIKAQNLGGSIVELARTQDVKLRLPSTRPRLPAIH